MHCIKVHCAEDQTSLHDEGCLRLIEVSLYVAKLKKSSQLVSCCKEFTAAFRCKMQVCTLQVTPHFTGSRTSIRETSKLFKFSLNFSISFSVIRVKPLRP